MMHPDTKLCTISAEKGLGVVATRRLPMGTITWAADKLDQQFTQGQVSRMEPVYQEILDKYCYRDHDGVLILCWDTARFVNHSYRSNCISTAYNFELAVRDIEEGEELTDDYGYLNVDEPIYFPKEDGSDRIAVMPDDLLHFYKHWDALLENAFTCFNQVEQKLWIFLDEAVRRKAKAVADGTIPMDSILNCYYNPSQSKT